jgi:uncharacterized membrane protein YhiD involved in acid resistance
MLNSLTANALVGGSGPLQALAGLLVCLVLTLITSFVYRFTHSGYAYSRSYSITMVCVALVITMMMTVIGNYLVLSLGLIGALSVIRFRTAIKDPKDVAFLFICIATGLACATHDYAVAVMGTLFINCVLVVLHYLRFGANTASDYILTFSLPGDDARAPEVAAVARQRVPRFVFRSYARLSEEESQYVYALKLGRNSEEDLIAYFRQKIPLMQNVSLVAPEASVEI